MKRNILILLLLVLSSISCAEQSASNIHNIYSYCAKSKSNPNVDKLIKNLGLEFDGGNYSKYYKPLSRTDIKLLNITLNPQPTYDNIQGIAMFWQKEPGLSYEEIQKLAGMNLPKRDSKSIQTDQSSQKFTRFYILGKDNPGYPDIAQVTFTCKKNDLNSCWQFDIDCFGFVHPE